jgi:predicted dehydrogenase
VKVGVIGCGAISGAYLKQCPEFEILEIAALSDLVPERAAEKAQEFNVARVCTVEEVLADPEIEIVLNLTIPAAHYEVSRSIVSAGKSVWSEKPLTLTRDQGRDLLALARKQKVLVGCAPDTFLGGGHQTCIKLINDGVIGEPVSATAFMSGHGPEGWHPNPAFYYKEGAGPLFDMGPYYLTALIAMLGPARRVTGSTRISFPTRTITSQPFAGEVVEVEVPTHVTGAVDFASGAIATVIMSFDTWEHHLPQLEVHGTLGSLSVPDPNGPGGTPKVSMAGSGTWEDVPLSHGYAELSRSTGVADMAYALRSGRAFRANGDVAFHVVDIMHAFYESSDQGRHIELESTCERPAPLPVGLAEGKLDE